MIKNYLIILFFLSFIPAFAIEKTLESSTFFNSTKASPEEKIDSLLDLSVDALDNLDTAAINYIKKAQKLSLDNDKYAYSDILLVYGVYWKNFNNYYKSADYLVKALKLYEKQNDKFGIALAHKQLGETYRASSDFEEALENLFKAEELFIEIPDSNRLASVYNRIAAVYFEKYSDESGKKCIEYIDKSVNLAEKLNMNYLLINNYNILGAVYNNQKKYDQAIKYLAKALELTKKHSEYYHRFNVLENLADTYHKIGEYEKAVEYAKKSLELSKKKGIIVNRGYVHEILSKSYKKLGEYKKSLRHLYKSSQIKDSLYYINKNHAITELQTKYENEKAMQEIKQQKQIQKYQIIIFAVSLTLLSGIVLMFYNRHKTLKAKNELISKQNKELTELNNTKDKFFSILAHDLINPIGSFSGLAKILADDFDNFNEKEKRESLELLRDNASNLSELLDNLLTWSRSQRGVLSLEPIEITPKKIINSNVNLMKYQCENKGITIETDITSNIPIRADYNMLSAILRNIISNAVKFTSENGRITVGTKESETDLIFFVKDTGIGMDKKDIDKLFRLDVSLSNSGTNNEQGTGLGLIICKEFVEKHSGKIWVESEKNKGTTFYFTIPLVK